MLIAIKVGFKAWSCTHFRRTFFCCNVLKASLHHKSYNNEEKPAISAVQLSHRSVVEISGSDSIALLQGLVSNDVTKLPDKKCLYAVMLNKKGRIEHDFIMYWPQQDKENCILLDCETNSMESVLKSFKLYKLRKKVDITPRTDLSVWQMQLDRSLVYPVDIKDYNTLNEILAPKLFEKDVHPLDSKSIIALAPDPRLSWLGWRVIASFQPCSDNLVKSEDVYHKSRYHFGIPEGTSGIIPGKSLPLETNIDYMNGIDFNKGCYLGQELTARSYFTGVVRKRLMPVYFKTSTALNIEQNPSLYNVKGSKTGKFLSIFKNQYGLALINCEYQTCRSKTLRGVIVYINRTYWWPNK